MFFFIYLDFPFNNHIRIRRAYSTRIFDARIRRAYSARVCGARIRRVYSARVFGTRATTAQLYPGRDTFEFDQDK